jgi:putative thioredoxin
MSNDSPTTIEATPETFERDAIERSREVPVLVDFWAEWCAPCRQLGPVLEKLAGEYEGKFVLVKADTEALPDVATSFGVRSIPAVFALKDGQVVDGFVGAQPESVIRAFIDRLMPTPAEALVAEAAKLESTEPEAALSRYHEAIALNPDDPRARIKLGRFLLAQGRAEEVRALIVELERRGYLEPDAERLKAELTLHGHHQGAEGIEAARASLAAHPEDLGRKFELAEALAAAGQYPEALDLCLDLVERDRKGVGERARQTMLAIFQVLPADSELINEYRRRLSFVL